MEILSFEELKELHKDKDTYDELCEAINTINEDVYKNIVKEVKENGYPLDKIKVVGQSYAGDKINASLSSYDVFGETIEEALLDIMLTAERNPVFWLSFKLPKKQEIEVIC